MRAQAVRTFSWRQMSQWIRSDRLEITDKGRWGPRWLHRLIWRAAMNVGMIRHMINETVSLSYIEISDDALFKAINDQVLCYLNENFHRDDLIVLMGNDRVREAMMEARDYTTFAGKASAKYGRQDVGMRIMGLPVYCLPNMDGFLVLPRSAIQ